jgi:tRNA (guanine37-N1)-methyltransferase
MRFDIISLFPESVEPYLNASILKRAKSNGQVEFFVHQLRDFALDKHKTVDDTPYGGGPGMVLKVEPLALCLEQVLTLAPAIKREKTRVLVTAAKGKVYTQGKARELSVKYDRIILICGRYEGIDERFVENFCDEEISIGEYVLTGGELAALIVVDSVTRLLPGVLGNEESPIAESYTEKGITEHPQYTKPEEFRGYAVPEVLLSGHHKNIELWQEENRGKTASEKKQT